MNLPNRTARLLPLRWLIAVVFGMCVAIAVVGAFAHDVGQDLAGERGVWIGWAVTFVVTLIVCWIITRRFANPMIPTLSGALVGMGIASAAEEAVGQLGSERLVKPIGFAAAVLGVAVGLTIFNWIARRQNR